MDIETNRVITVLTTIFIFEDDYVLTIYNLSVCGGTISFLEIVL